ncbi:16S rRNA (uracil(1498)-N(3))-methyltransferase [Mycoplasma sp. CSL10137]|uniref:16S rRNA (uracil(1498)-N(3))-methyltransferase n=1 Tax=unclassified Mycoplasma TaxID=2683645 RepID=UPI00197C4497|nr:MULTISPECIES: 16S rRNA (uracil(1498)-N(3))-methyltransferase [unclassified Mycoplasma]MBN4083734.1 16S rRNA (uracil(1498)-N(3))-methyltransferase [Mycoplasma sp. CSL10137]MBN4084634.1 16S rRNA (uracil(1498)-N(3))-methyltransferase [Mycoplasma sp. CSL10166]MBU4693112.1 16S rRNA (uracil(1498)-N(3))-methyltransferase [Mycoplasma sp. CSL7491-lung]
MNRFFVNKKEDNYFILDKEAQKHIKVLRLDGKKIICVYENNFFECLVDFDKAHIIKEINENHELQNDIILLMSLIKYDRFEWLLQKSTELGVKKIIPLITEHTNGELYSFNKFEKKRQRFEEILKNAAEQSFRNQIPTLGELTKLSNIDFKKDYKIYIAHEKINSENNQIPSEIEKNVYFVVGPEGGFSNLELDKLVLDNKNVNLVSLGKRILRAETAAIYMLSKIKNS